MNGTTFQNLIGGGYKELPNVEFITVPYKNKFMEYFCKGVFSYLLFKNWERGVYHYIKKSGLLEKIDLIHYAAPVGYREPGYLWKCDKPYVWGPFGGMYLIPREFIKNAPRKTRLAWRLKNFLNTIQFHSARIKKVLKKSDVLISCTKTQLAMCNSFLKENRVRYIAENGIDKSRLESVSEKFIEEKFLSKTVEIFWVGTNNDRKNAQLLLDALSLCREKNFHCTFIGEACESLSLLADENLHDRFSFFNHLPREKVLDMYKSAHLLAITSAMEANTTVMWEAMENCVPVISVAHCGMKDVVKNGKTGIAIPLSTMENMRENFALEIEKVCCDISVLKKFALNIRRGAVDEYSQEFRMDFFEQCYKDAIVRYKEKCGAKE